MLKINMFALLTVILSQETILFTRHKNIVNEIADILV